MRDGGREVCVMMVAGVRNAGQPGALKRQDGRAGAGVTVTVTSYQAVDIE